MCIHGILISVHICYLVAMALLISLTYEAIVCLKTTLTTSDIVRVTQTTYTYTHARTHSYTCITHTYSHTNVNTQLCNHMH